MVKLSGWSCPFTPVLCGKLWEVADVCAGKLLPKSPLLGIVGWIGLVLSTMESTASSVNATSLLVPE